MLLAELKINGSLLGKLTIVNDGTGTEELGNYDYWFQASSPGVELWGRLTTYPRIEGPWKLLQKVLECVLNEKGHELRYLGRRP